MYNSRGNRVERNTGRKNFQKEMLFQKEPVIQLEVTTHAVSDTWTEKQ